MSWVVVDALQSAVGPFATREAAQVFADEATAHEKRNVNDWVIDPEVHELHDPEHLMAQYVALNGPLR